MIAIKAETEASDEAQHATWFDFKKVVRLVTLRYASQSFYIAWWSIALFEPNYSSGLVIREVRSIGHAQRRVIQVICGEADPRKLF